MLAERKSKLKSKLLHPALAIVDVGQGIGGGQIVPRWNAPCSEGAAADESAASCGANVFRGEDERGGVEENVSCWSYIPAHDICVAGICIPVVTGQTKPASVKPSGCSASVI